MASKGSNHLHIFIDFLSFFTFPTSYILWGSREAGVTKCIVLTMRMREMLCCNQSPKDIHMHFFFHKAKFSELKTRCFGVLAFKVRLFGYMQKVRAKVVHRGVNGTSLATQNSDTTFSAVKGRYKGDHNAAAWYRVTLNTQFTLAATLATPTREFNKAFRSRASS